MIYRGERVRADRDGLRGRLFDSDRAELDLSLGGALPVRSERNDARRGMPALDPVLEFGPSLVVRLARSADRRRTVELRLPARAAYAVDGRGLHGVGAVFAPQLRASWRAAAWGWNVDAAAGPMYASRCDCSVSSAPRRFPGRFTNRVRWSAAARTRSPVSASARCLLAESSRRVSAAD